MPERIHFALNFLGLFFVLHLTHRASGCDTTWIKKQLASSANLHSTENHTHSLITFYLNQLENCSCTSCIWTNLKTLNAWLKSQKKYAPLYKITHRSMKYFQEKADSFHLFKCREMLLYEIYGENALLNDFKEELERTSRLAEKVLHENDLIKHFYYSGWLAFNLNLMGEARRQLRSAIRIILQTKRNYDSFDAEIFGWYGNTFLNELQYDSSIYFRRFAMNISLQNKDELMVADCQRYISAAFFNRKMYDSCLCYAIPSYEYYRKKNWKDRCVWLLGFILKSAYKTNQKNIMKKFEPEVHNNSLYDGLPFYFVHQRYMHFFILYRIKHDFENSLKYYERYVQIKDSLLYEEKKSNVQQELMQFKLQQDLQNIKIEELRKSKDLERKLSEQKQANMYFVVIGIILFIFLGFTFRSLNQKKRNLKIITEQRTILQIKNREISDSIHYARRLQMALLPNEKSLEQELKSIGIRASLLYLPKDIVAGDFYFYFRSSAYAYLAVGDCTGHGVPGAMVSVLCMNALLQSIREYRLTETNEILDRTRHLILEWFSKSEENIQDGMDCSLLRWDISNPASCQWSGANIPLWILRHGKIDIIRPDKMPVGKGISECPFIAHTVSVQKNDYIFLFTDGFADQFGGEKGKKMKTSHFCQWLESHISPEIGTSAVAEQLHSLHRNWKGSREQTDDICVWIMNV